MLLRDRGRNIIGRELETIVTGAKTSRWKIAWIHRTRKSNVFEYFFSTRPLESFRFLISFHGTEIFPRFVVTRVTPCCVRYERSASYRRRRESGISSWLGFPPRNIGHSFYENVYERASRTYGKICWNVAPFGSIKSRPSYLSVSRYFRLYSRLQSLFSIFSLLWNARRRANALFISDARNERIARGMVHDFSTDIQVTGRYRERNVVSRVKSPDAKETRVNFTLFHVESSVLLLCPFSNKLFKIRGSKSSSSIVHGFHCNFRLGSKDIWRARRTIVHETKISVLARHRAVLESAYPLADTSVSFARESRRL